MKFTFIGVPGEDHKSLHMYGVDMPLGEAVEVSAVAARKLSNHPHFMAEGPEDATLIVETEEAPRKKPGRPRKEA